MLGGKKRRCGNTFVKPTRGGDRCVTRNAATLWIWKSRVDRELDQTKLVRIPRKVRTADSETRFLRPLARFVIRW